MGRYIPRGIQTLIPALRNSRRRNAKKLTYTGRLGDSPDDSIQYWITTNLLVHLAPLHLGLTSRRRGRSSSRQKSKPLTESRGYPLSHPKRDLSTLNDARVAKKGGFDKVTLGPEVSVAFCNMNRVCKLPKMIYTKPPVLTVLFRRSTPRARRCWIILEALERDSPIDLCETTQ